MPKTARYAKEIKMLITLQGEEGTGRIFVPYFDIVYGDVTREDADAGVEVPVRFEADFVTETIISQLTTMFFVTLPFDN